MAILSDLKNGVDEYTNDMIAGTAENDTVNLYGGNDYFYDIYDSNDFIADTKRFAADVSGNDIIWAGGGNDMVVSIFDSTTILDVGYAEAFHGGAGYDQLNFVPCETGVTVDLAQYTAVNGHGARALITGFEVVHGSAHKDFLLGDSASNRLEGWMGDDVIDGRGGDDFLFGGYSNDWINGGDGDDIIFGGDTDPFYNDDDTIYGGNGYDLIYAGLGNDYVNGEAGSDKMFGGLGNDRMYGGAAQDEMYGDAGDDRIAGGDDGDFISGGDGNDALHGEAGRDTMIAGIGNDILIGGRGGDLLHGDAGRDTFRFLSMLDSGLTSSTIDKIADFRHLVDRIDVSALDANAPLAGNQAFSFIGDHGFTRAGQISSHYSSSTNETVLRFNTDADTASEMMIKLTGHITLSSGDFLL